MLDRGVQINGTTAATVEAGMGSFAFSPLKQGILSDKYLKGIPENSRAAKPDTYLSTSNITTELLDKVAALNEIAKNRGQTLAQMAVAWLLGVGNVTSVLVGASSPEQIIENVNATHNTDFSEDELKEINKII
jgi:L-glyceraldehyde 3-phosphate reductase